MENQAHAYYAMRVQNAQGGAQRFSAVLAEYEKARELTKKRLYYEAIEEILSNAQEKILLPKGTSDRVLPFLPLTLGAQESSPQGRTAAAATERSK